MSGEDEPVGREVAYRVFAAEYDDATLSHTESDDDRAPNYVITPTGARVNRLFAVGTLTEVSRVNEEMVRARVVDPTGAFVVYAGQYQPEALAFLEGAEPPEFVAVTGKARTFEPDDGDRIYTSVRPESIATVDAATRDRWVVTTAERTDERIGTIAAAATEDARDEELTALLRERGVETGLARGIPLALAHYGTSPDYLAALSELATDAVRVIAGDREEVAPFEIAPSGEGEGDAAYADLAGELEEEREPAPDEPTTADDVAEPEATDESADPAPEAEPDAVDEGEAPDAAAGESGGSGPEPATAESDPDSPQVGGTEPEVDPEPAAGAKPDPGTDAGEPEDARPEVESEPEEADADSAADSGVDAENGDEEAAADLEADVEGDAGMYEMDDEERQEIEDEFGTEFTTGTDVEEPGEVDIETPDPDEIEGESGDGSEELGDFDAGGEFAETESEVTDGTADEPDEGTDAEPEPEETDEGEESEPPEGTEAGAEDVDLQEHAVETMQELDDGDGADREAVVERVASETGADEGDVESAIEEALMSGRCYEPDDGALKPI